MPSSTFFNLPEAKRQRLLDAAWQEFTTVSYMDASINKIIQNAEISRGSFYQYFSGKQDLFAYLLQTLVQSAKEMFAAQLTVHGSDLFAAILGMYDLVLWRKSKCRRSLTQTRIYQLIRLNTELDLNEFSDILNPSLVARDAQALLEASGYALQDSQQCFAVIQMFISICMFALTDALRNPDHEQKNRRLLEQQLDIIRRGLLQSQKEGTESC